MHRLLLSGLTAAVLFLACSAEGPRRPPNIVLITFDTLRADHLGCYGYGRDTSPHLDAFAAAATRYPHALAAAPWTVPSHASLFTGRYPFEHGARTFPTFGDSLKVFLHSLDESRTTLAEVLKEEGYETGAFVANTGFLSPSWKLNQGFTTYHAEKVPAEMLNARVAEWLNSVLVRGKEPFFLFINYIDTHRPYNTTPRPGFPVTLPPEDNETLMNRLYAEVMPGVGDVPADLVQAVIDQYDVAVANVDEQFGALLEELRSLDVYDSTLIVATSDHGEYFGEHHLVEHVKDVYQEAVHVPLIVKFPNQTAPRTEETVVSSVDLPGLVLSAFPRETAKRLREQFPYAAGEHPVISELYYSERKDVHHPVWGKRFRRERTAVFLPPYKYIASSDGDHALYDLTADPGEARNLIAGEPETAERLDAILREFKEAAGEAADPGDVPTLTEEEKERLRSLGYSGN